MAILDVTESPRRDGVRGQIGRRLYRREFTVTTNNANTAQKEVLGDIRIPQPYTFYQTTTEIDTGAVVRSVTATQDEASRKVWRVVVEYDSEYEIRDNPFAEPPDIVFDSEMVEEAVYARYDWDFNPETSQNPSAADPRNAVVANGFLRGDFCTSAGEPFDPPIRIQKVRPIVRIGRNEPGVTLANKVLYEGCVNLSMWNGLQPRQAWLKSWRVTSHVQKSTTVNVPDIYYCRSEYTFALKAETWDLQIPDIGSYYLDYSSGTAQQVVFKTKDGHARMGRLDHSVAAQPGKKLAAGTDVQFLRFSQLMRAVDFTPLNINLNLALSERRARPRGRAA